jgi:ABC-type antimicrobial peptide transport system permease subunit
MFFRIGLKNLFKEKSRMLLSIIIIAFGTSIVFGVNLSSDMFQEQLNEQINESFGNINYIISREDWTASGKNPGKVMSNDFIPYLENLTGVSGAVNRLLSKPGYYHMGDMSKLLGDKIVGINASDPFERTIGRSQITHCISGYDRTHVTLEDLLTLPGIERPIVIAYDLYEKSGFNIGDLIYIRPTDSVALYATDAELENIGNDTLLEVQLKNAIDQSPWRFEPFTVVGIIIDDSEAPEPPKPDIGESIGKLNPALTNLYINIDDYYRWVFNKAKNTSSYFLLSTTSELTLESIRSTLTPNPFGNYTVQIFDTRAYLQEYVEYASNLLRVVLLALGGVSIVVCSQLVKAIMQMGVSDRLREIGIYLAMGFKQKSVYQMFTAQILFIASIGTGIGIMGGFLVPMNFRIDVLAGLIGKIDVELPPSPGFYSVSPASIIITFFTGLISPLLFGLSPLWKMRNWKVIQLLNPVYMELQSTHDKNRSFWARTGKTFRQMSEKLKNRSRMQKTPNKIRDTLRNLLNQFRADKQLQLGLLWLSLIIICDITFTYAIIELYSQPKLIVSSTHFQIWTTLIVLSIIILLLALIELVGMGIRKIAGIFILILRRYLGPIGKYLPESIHANSRRVRNMMGTLLIGTTLVVSILVVSDSLTKGNNYSMVTLIGGDIAIFTPFIQRSDLESLRELPEIEEATTIFYGIMETWRSNNPDIRNYIVNKMDAYGGWGFNGTTENMNYIIIDPEEYIRMNTREIMFRPITPNPRESLADFIRRLNVPGSVIIEDDLSRTLGKGVDEFVNVAIAGLEGRAKIVGTARYLPAGAPFMNKLDGNKSSSRTAFMSYTTFQSFANNFLGKMDLMIKNTTLPTELSENLNQSDILGYTSGMILKQDIKNALFLIPGIEGISYRFSTFAPNIPAMNLTVNASRIIQSANTIQLENKSSLSIPNRMYIIDPETELDFAFPQQKIIESDTPINNYRYLSFRLGGGFKAHNSTVDEILYTVDNYRNWLNETSYGTNPLCIVNKYTVEYAGINRFLYIYENKIGDVIQVQIPQLNNTGIMLNFTVVGLVDNHLPYYLPNSTEKAGFNFSPKTLNYNFARTTASSQNLTAFDLFDLESNVFFTSFKEVATAITNLTGNPDYALPFQYACNHVYLDVRDGINVTQKAGDIQAQFQARNLTDLQVFDYRTQFIEKLGNTGVLTIRIAAGYKEQDALTAVHKWMIEHGYAWEEGSVATVSKFQGDLVSFTSTFEMFNTIAISSLGISLIGLCTIIYESTRKRQREIGILRAMGFHSSHLYRAIAVESFIIAFVGILVGFCMGLLIIYQLFTGINSQLVFPLFFSIPWGNLLILGISLGFITFFAGNLIARGLMHQSVAMNVRYRE